jgi:hypothetical protein
VPAPPRGWDAGAGRALADAAWPLVTSGSAALAGLWAVAAVVLPWLVRGRSAALDVVAATSWAAGLAAATAALAEWAGGSGAHPPGLVLGAVAAAVTALALARAGP